MEHEFSSFTGGGDLPEKDPATARSEDQRSRKRFLGSGLMELEEEKLGISEIVADIYEGVSSIVEYSLQWKDCDEELKKRALEVEVKERSLREKTVELEKKEERLREVEERERKIELLEKSVTLRLVKEEEDNDVKRFMESCLVSLVLEKKEEEVMEGLEEREKEIECFSKLIENRVREFELKEKEWIESRRKEAEVMGVSLRQLEVKEKELRSLEEAIKERRTVVEKKEEVTEAKDEELRLFDVALKEKWTEVKKKEEISEAKEKELKSFSEVIKEKLNLVEKKEEIFEAKEKAKTEEMEQKSMYLELREKKLEEMVQEFELKRREMEKPSFRAETSKRSRVKLLAEKGSEAGYLIHPSKRHRSFREHSHNDDGDEEEMETNLAYGVSTCTLSTVMSEIREGEIEEVFRIDDSDDSDEDNEPISCVDSEFNDFENSVSCFMVGQVWALYDPNDTMPRLYAQIKRVTKSRPSFQVTWLESRDEESVPVACGRFKYGNTETIKSHLKFSHEMHSIRHGRSFMAVTPRKGETWALYRDWSKSWENNPEQHKPPYEYDFVEVLLNFDENIGIGVTYLGKVEGFVSIFTQAVQHDVFSFFVTPDEIHRFSHKVPSFRMTGEEKEGIPPGSFELDPAAIPGSVIKPDHSTREEAKETETQREDCGVAGEVKKPDGSSKDIPIVLD